MIEVFPPDRLQWQGRVMRCVLGRGGVTADKREGDGATPLATMALRRVLYRPDRIKPPVSGLPVTAIGPRDGWCDDPPDPAYNTLVSLPHAGGHEVLWREDGLYDLLAVLGWNDAPPQPGRGSAIFLHVARPDFSPTRGCIALALDDLRRVLEACGPETELRVNPPA